MGNFCNVLVQGTMIPTYNGKIICKQFDDVQYVRYVTQEKADEIIANNSPISEWYWGAGATSYSLSELRNEDSTPIDVNTQIILIEDTPEITDWYIDVEQKFIRV